MKWLEIMNLESKYQFFKTQTWINLVPKAYRTTLIQRLPPPKHHISQFHEDKEAIYTLSLIKQNLHSLEQYTEDW